jgi:hypothetical protein
MSESMKGWILKEEAIETKLEKEGIKKLKLVK